MESLRGTFPPSWKNLSSYVKQYTAWHRAVKISTVLNNLSCPVILPECFFIDFLTEFVGFIPAECYEKCSCVLLFFCLNKFFKGYANCVNEEQFKKSIYPAKEHLLGNINNGITSVIPAYLSGNASSVLAVTPWQKWFRRCGMIISGSLSDNCTRSVAQNIC